MDNRVIADKLPLTLDKNGAGKLTVDKVPKSRQPQDLLLEATYSDPNGEVQTIRSTQTLWPAAVVAGIKTEGWVSSSQKIKFQALALDLTRQAAGRRGAGGESHRPHHHHHAQAHGGRLLHLRQQNQHQRTGQRLQRQERFARPAAVRNRAERSR